MPGQSPRGDRGRGRGSGRGRTRLGVRCLGLAHGPGLDVMAGLGGFLLCRFRGWIDGGRPAGLTRGMSGRFAEQRFGLLSWLGGASGGPGLGLGHQGGQGGQLTLGGYGFLWHWLNLGGCGFF